MTKTEEALCNGITFSVPRMVPTAIQEGELDNALYYVLVYLTPQLDKMTWIRRKKSVKKVVGMEYF